MVSTQSTASPSAEDRLSPAERVTRQIRAALERGVRPWVKPWGATGSAPLLLPRRATGEAYRGVNVLALWAAAEVAGFASPYWLTFKQCLDMNAAVRKGERGSPVVFYKPIAHGADQTKDDAEEASPDRRHILRGYIVFNADQVAGLPQQFYPAPPPPAARDEEDARLDALFATVPAIIRHGGDRAFYASGPDIIQLPPKTAFPDPMTYHSTKGHELCHWTRHPSRLDRDFGQKRFGDHGYALEEVTAEIGAAFLGAQIGLPADHIEDHARYISGWLQVLTETPNAFLTAAGKAQAAADYLLQLMGVPPTGAIPEPN